VEFSLWEILPIDKILLYVLPIGQPRKQQSYCSQWEVTGYAWRWFISWRCYTVIQEKAASDLHRSVCALQKNKLFFKLTFPVQISVFY